MVEGLGIQNPVFIHPVFFVSGELGANIAAGRARAQYFDHQGRGERNVGFGQQRHFGRGNEGKVGQEHIARAKPHRHHLTVQSAKPVLVNVGAEEEIHKVGEIGVAKAYGRVHGFFAVDEVGVDARFEPGQKIIRRPHFPADGLGL
jgi:hypothetical protein